MIEFKHNGNKLLGKSVTKMARPLVTADFKEATRVFETLFKDGVTPVTLQDVISDMYADVI